MTITTGGGGANIITDEGVGVVTIETWGGDDGEVATGGEDRSILEPDEGGEWIIYVTSFKIRDY